MSIVKIGDHADVNRELVGNKAFSLNTMARQGLPVPPAFVLTVDECNRYLSGGTLTDEVRQGLRTEVAALERALDRTFGGGERPLLVSVRSGAARSMPGMMDTILNLGINTDVEQRLCEWTGDSRYPADTHRRFADQFRGVVGVAPPDDPWEQLEAAVGAVFQSWQSPRAIAYRRHHGIPDVGGTAVTVQAMVFGNLDDKSGTGVLFTRDPVSSASAPFGEWLPGGQGEDVVSGRHTPLPLDELRRSLPKVHEELMTAAQLLERSMRNVLDIEFTVESGALWLLQCRVAKRSATAAIHHAVALEREGIVSVSEALAMISPQQLAAFLRPRLAPRAQAEAVLLAAGETACPGVASGVVVTDADEADDMAAAGVDVVLARPTTDPNDVHGMLAAVAVITEIGGATSHAAVVSRELNRVCVVGCGEGTLMDLAGRTVTVDATDGEILDGRLEVETPSPDHPDVAVIQAWLRECPETPATTQLKSVLAIT
ncbi:pyruvate, phosphate dikinase [Mycolicibacterium sp. XJ1819]